MGEEPTLSVRGEATAEVSADLASLTVRVEVSLPDRAAALAEASARLRRLRDVLTGAPGVREVTVGDVVVYDDGPRPRGGRDPRTTAVVTGTVLTDPLAAGAIARAVVDADAGVGGVAWLLAADSSAPRQVRAQAVAQARQAAEDFALAVGGAVGPLLQLADAGLLDGAGVAGLRGMRVMASAAGGDPLQLDPRPVTVTASVEARYRLLV